MEFNKVVTVKKEHSKEQFLRAAMIKLASDIETPIDAVKADFGEVKESVFGFQMVSIGIVKTITVFNPIKNKN